MKINYIEITQFLTLFAVLFVSSIIFSKSGSQSVRFLIICIDAVLYVGWGVWHHYAKDRFNKLILIEYALVSFLIIILAALGLGVVRFM